MRNIAVIGAGQIGSRHIQSLGKLTEDCNLYVLDAQPAALTATQERVVEGQPNPNVTHHYLGSVNQLPAQLDLAIIATSAEHRLPALTDLVANTEISQLVLEKVLFQQVAHYQAATDLLEANKIPAWVNCPRRMMPSLNQLTSELKGGLNYEVVGNNWGLGCNAIHFIDHCAHLVGSTNIELDTSELEPQIYPAKRAGCIEFAGTLKGSFRDNGSQFQLTCAIDDGPVSYVTNISSTQTQISFVTPGAEATTTNLATSTSERKAFSMPFQSELTKSVADSLASSGRCELPSFDESKRLHLPFIQALLEFTARISGERSDILNIT